MLSYYIAGMRVGRILVLGSRLRERRILRRLRIMAIRGEIGVLARKTLYARIDSNCSLSNEKLFTCPSRVYVTRQSLCIVNNCALF